jgi:DNA integrity scanning protein DisA with diadenylate cyclase activity
MKSQRFTKQFATFLETAVRVARGAPADAILLLLEGTCDWEQIKDRTEDLKVIVAGDSEEEIAGAAEAGLYPVVLGEREAAVFEKLTKAVLESVAHDVLSPGAEVVAVYSAFEPETIDSISFISLDEHLGRLTARDLKKLETSVPLATLKTVVDLAVEIGREGREGKPVGTMFVTGDTRRVLRHCHPAGFDPVRGYKRKDRDLNDPRVREAIKEIAQLDGAFVVSSDAIVERSCQLVDAAHANVTLSAGLGARHWAGAAVSRITNALAVVVSESTGTMRLFQHGEVVLRVEPLRRPMKWKGFEHEAPGASETRGRPPLVAGE